MASTEASCIAEKPGLKSPPSKDGNWQLLEENGAADRLSERSDASFATTEPSRPLAPTGKLKKTALKLFGGKRSICTLPSFFGGKNKGPGKGSSRKSLCKSKTHDGISDVGYEEVSSGCRRTPSDGGPDYPPPQLPTSQSAQLGADANLRAGFVRQSLSLSGSSEAFEKKAAGEKSLFTTRPKRGFRGLFNSIRRHRKNKAVEPERTELQEWTLRDAVAEEQVKTDVREAVEKPKDSKNGSQKRSEVLSEGEENFQDDGIASEIDEPQEGDPMVANGSTSARDVPRGATDSEDSQVIEMEENVRCTNPAFGDLSVPLPPEDLENSPSCVTSGDQLSLMFEDVTSLKSFDSFTGCGDIIAEPDIDSITESSTCADRGREVAKRSSCLVTYQGGGEEMAVPEEIEDYLHQMWEGKGDNCYEPHLPEIVTKCELPGVNGSLQEGHLYSEGTTNDVDLLTPHSDQQESAPNSDEGYYDSTTPGLEDEAGDGLEEIKKDRLPRDSYSGDALYEFYEPDDTLMSPSQADESWFDRKVPPPEIFGRFLDFAFPAEKDLAQTMHQKTEIMETEEERLAAIRKHLLYCEMNKEPTLKHLDKLSKDQGSREKQQAECNPRGTDLVGKSLNYLGCDQVASHSLKGSLELGPPVEKQDWKEKFHNSGCDSKSHSSCLIQRLEKSSVLDTELERTMLESYMLSGLALERSVTYPFYRTHGCRSCPPCERDCEAGTDARERPTESKGESEQAVNFSQALVEFTGNGTLFSSLSESLGSTDSGEAFTQNLPALPVMVTFDIVDVEQDGEGECDQQLEINAEDALAASLDAFNDGYVPKESFAECDERMSPGDPLSSFQNFNWGVASLPRRLHLREPSPPLPEPLSLCRRSRSLDTESLDFVLANVQLSKGSFKPYELWSQRGSCKKDPGPNLSQGPAHCASKERRSDACVLSWPELQNVSYREVFPSRDGNPWECDQDPPAFWSTWDSLEQQGARAAFLHPGQDTAKETDGHPPTQHAGHPGLLAPRPLARPTNLPLQNPVGTPEVCAPHRPGEDVLAKKLAWVFPLGERGADMPPGFGFARSPEKAGACKPVNVMQPVPQLPSK